MTKILLSRVNSKTKTKSERSHLFIEGRKIWKRTENRTEPNSHLNSDLGLRFKSSKFGVQVQII